MYEIVIYSLMAAVVLACFGALSFVVGRSTGWERFESVGYTLCTIGVIAGCLSTMAFTAILVIALF